METSFDTNSVEAGCRKSFTFGAIEYAFRYCPAGAFLMGSPTNEEYRDSDETTHNVRLTRGFWTMETEVTQKMLKAVTGSDSSTFQGDDLPANMVTFDVAQEFCEKLNKGLADPDWKVSLPTEAQWEYACRAGTTGRFGDGAESMAEVGWSFENAERTTHPVARKKPNAWGIYDMHGNLWEWCVDWYNDDYAPGDAVDPVETQVLTFLALRGGSWNAPANQCRSASRLFCAPECAHDHIGFRAILVPAR